MCFQHHKEDNFTKLDTKRLFWHVSNVFKNYLIFDANVKISLVERVLKGDDMFLDRCRCTYIGAKYGQVPNTSCQKLSVCF